MEVIRDMVRVPRKEDDLNSYAFVWMGGSSDLGTGETREEEVAVVRKVHEDLDEF